MGEKGKGEGALERTAGPQTERGQPHARLFGARRPR
jgi:hypothetical protein